MNFNDGKGNIKDMMSMWMNIPGKLSEGWMKFYKAFTPGDYSFPFFRKEEEQKSLPFDNLNMYEEWMKMTGDTIQKVLQMAPSGGVGPETYFKLFDGMKAYFSLYEFWGSWTKTMAPFGGKTPTPDEWKGVQEKLAVDYTKVLDTVIGRKPPETMEEIMKMQGKVMGQGIEMFAWFRDPWSIMMRQGPQVLSKAATGDISAVREGFSLWQTAISDTIGKLLHIPSLGYSREYEERQKEVAEAYVKFATSLPAFYSEFYQAGSKAFDKLLDKSKDIPADSSPESFKKFYALWLKTNEDTFYDLFKREEFTNMMNEVMKRGLDFKRKMDFSTSKYLESLSIPNREEMNDVYKAIYDLKHEVREMSKEVQVLKENRGTDGGKP